MADDIFVDVHFPKAGIDRSMGFGKQPNRPLPGGEYARTTFLGQNVRAFEPTTNRGRGGQRPGLSKYFPVAVVSGWIIQALGVIVTTAERTPPTPPTPPPTPTPVTGEKKTFAAKTFASKTFASGTFR